MKRGVDVAVVVLVWLGIFTVCEAGLPLEWRRLCGNFDRSDSSGGSGNRSLSCPVPHRSRSALLVDATSVRVFGGSAGVVALSDMWTYSILDGRWTQDASDWRETTANWTLSCRTGGGMHPVPRFAATLFPDTSQLLFVGPGLCKEPPNWLETETVSVADFWFYAQSTGRWARLANRNPPPVKGGASIIWNRKIFTFGGQSVDYPYEYTAIVYEMDLLSGVASAESPRIVQTIGVSMPAPRSMHSAVLTGDSMLVFGGRNATHVFSDAWTLDLATYAWKQLIPFAGADIPTARSSHAATICASASPDKSDLLIVYGGADINGHLLDDSYAYSTGQNAWFKIRSSSPPQARRDATMHCSREGQVWLFGGEGPSSSFFNDLYTLI